VFRVIATSPGSHADVTTGPTRRLSVLSVGPHTNRTERANAPTSGTATGVGRWPHDHTQSPGDASGGTRRAVVEAHSGGERIR
jgi:hypothetical protein